MPLKKINSMNKAEKKADWQMPLKKIHSMNKAEKKADWQMPLKTINSMNKAEKKADWQMPLKKIQPQKSEFDHKNKHPENHTNFLKFYLRRHCLLVGGSEFICNGCLVKFRFSKREAPRETC